MGATEMGQFLRVVGRAATAALVVMAVVPATGCRTEGVGLAGGGGPLAERMAQLASVAEPLCEQFLTCDGEDLSPDERLSRMHECMRDVMAEVFPLRSTTPCIEVVDELFTCSSDALAADCDASAVRACFATREERLRGCRIAAPDWDSSAPPADMPPDMMPPGGELVFPEYDDNIPPGVMQRLDPATGRVIEIIE